MTITVLVPPAGEPVSLAEAKLHLRVDGTDDDTLISGLITSCRERVERLLGQAFITRRVREVRDAPPRGAIVHLAVGPVSTVHAVAVVAEDGAKTPISADVYTLDSAHVPGRLGLRAGQAWPGADTGFQAFEIEYDAGYGAAGADTPGPLRDAVLQLVAEAYAYRAPAERAEDAEEAALPAAVNGLLAPYRPVRL